MAKPEQYWLQKPNVSVKWALGAMLIWIAILVGFDHTQFALDLESKVSRPLDFRIRKQLNRSPVIAPNIKIFGIDDSTVSWLKSPNPTIFQWIELLENFERSGAKVIIIDALFTMANIPPGSEDVAAMMIPRLSEIQAPIIVGAFIAPSKLRYREPIDVDKSDYLISNKILNAEGKEAKRQASQLNLPVARGKYLYGPDTKLRDYFKIGHILYDGSGQMDPFIRMGEDRSIPHMMLMPFNKIKFFKNHMYYRGFKIPSYRDGRLALNFSSYPEYLARTIPLRNEFILAARKVKSSNVNPGDYVYVIPGFYTGNVDFKMTPFGMMPGGYAHLAVLNSILTEQWLKPIWVRELIIASACIIGVLLGLKSGWVLSLAMTLFLGGFSWFIFAMWLFSWEGIILPWIVPLVGFCGSAITIYVERARVAEKKSQFIHSALDGALSPDEIGRLARNPEHIDIEARERVVTVMFIDVVGFSLFAESQMPRTAFDYLKKMMVQITNHVHRYGGVVNKNLGDGLLCFFGYSMDSEIATLDHSNQAVKCAISIQNENLLNTLQAHERGEPVYPLRIGINTSPVYLGNIGSETNIDFTVVGNGVNFAKRLETACRTHGILMGETTKELFNPFGLKKDGMKKIYINIKHYKENVVAYELDPFIDSPELKFRAEKAHKEATAAVRSEKRWKIENPETVVVDTNRGIGVLDHISYSGFSLGLDVRLERGDVLEVSLDSLDGNLGIDLDKSGLGRIRLEVRWSYENGPSWLYGARYLDLNHNDVELLVEYIRSHLDTTEKNAI